jgi:hypothetical protein
MAVWKGYIVLFGGFQDTGVKSKQAVNSDFYWLYVEPTALFRSNLSFRPVVIRYRVVQVEAD